MTRPIRLLWLALWPFGFAFGVVGELHQAATGIREPAWLAADLVCGWVFLAAGLLAWDRLPGNRIGPLVTAIGLTWFVGTYKPINDELLRWLAGSFQGWYEPLLGILVLVYPTGRFQSRVALVLAAAWLFEQAAWTAIRLALERPLSFYPDPRSATAAERYIADRLLLDEIGPVSLAASVMIAALVFLWIGRRWLAASPPARRVLAPVLLAGLVLVAAQVASGAGRVSGLVGPAINETWYFVALSLSRVIVAVGVLAGLLRSRLARSAVADLIVSLGAAPNLARLRESLVRALGDPTLTILRYADEAATYLDEHGRPIAVDAVRGSQAVTVLEVEGRRIAAILHDPALLDDPGLVDAVGAAVKLAIDNERLQRELEAQLGEVRASRARLVTAADEERRRVERDLHDGAQQRLVGLSFALRRARGKVGDGADPELDATLEEAAEELRAAIDELRELARGIHPSILTDVGLGPALESLARRSTVPVELHVGLEGRLPPAVESTAYYVAAEALTNIARYASASAVRLEARRSADTLRLAISDDGVGGADPARGSGISGLADRVAALGGELRVDSPAGGGTRIVAELPIP